MKKIRIFFTTLKEGISGIWKHRGMGFASIISILLALLILGVIIISTLSLNQAVGDIESKVDEIDVFIENDVSDEDLATIRDSIKKIDGVGNTAYKSKEDALNIFKKTIDDDEGYLLDGMEEAFPRSYVITMEDISKSEDFVKTAKDIPGVGEIRYYQDMIEKVVTISDYVQYGGIVAVIALIVISILIISNTIKLTVVARKREIQIKKYIGATNSVITGPFIIEGIVFGLIGSLIAFGLIYWGYKGFYTRYSKDILNILTTYLVEPEIIYDNILVIFVTLGVSIGILGSSFSLRKYLKV